MYKKVNCCNSVSMFLNNSLREGSGKDSKDGPNLFEKIRWQVTMPSRVKHPGKEWIMAEVAKFKKFQPQPKPTSEQKVVQGKKIEAIAGDPGDIHYKVIFRDGGHRLLKLNFLGQRLADVPLPSGSNFTIVKYEGQWCLSAKGGAEMYRCEDYLVLAMPKAG